MDDEQATHYSVQPRDSVVGDKLKNGSMFGSYTNVDRST